MKPQANPADKDFLDQVAVVRAVAQQLSSKADDLPKLVIVRLTVAPLIAAHGLASPQLTEALKVLQSSVVELKEAAEKAYGGNVLVATIAASNDQVAARTKRAAGTKALVMQTNFITIFRNYLLISPCRKMTLI